MSDEMRGEKSSLALDISRILLLSSEGTRILRRDSSFAFTAFQTDGRVNLCRVIDF